jgi:hypothetical protein
MLTSGGAMTSREDQRAWVCQEVTPTVSEELLEVPCSRVPVTINPGHPSSLFSAFKG